MRGDGVRFVNQPLSEPLGGIWVIGSDETGNFLQVFERPGRQFYLVAALAHEAMRSRASATLIPPSRS